MSTAVAEVLDKSETVAPPIPTLDDLQRLVAHLGVPANRILMRPMPGEATEADAVKLMDGEPKRLCELVDGVLVEKAMGLRETILAAAFIKLLGIWNDDRDAGTVWSSDGLTRMWSGRVRLPDAAFIRWDRFPGGTLPDEAISPVAPNLAVEILSESNTAEELHKKRDDYFQSGVEEIWVVDPELRTLAVYLPAKRHEPHRTLKRTDTLESPDLLPGFSIRLADVFNRLAPRK